MKGRRIIATLLLSSVLAASCATFASCDLIGSIIGSKDSSSTEVVTDCKVTWSVDSQVTVSVEGESGLPETVDSGTTIVFTVTAPEGYTVSVKKDTTTVNASSGKYSVRITKDATVYVTISKTIESLTVTPPTKLSGYLEGQTVDTAGMKVTVNYALGDSEDVTDYTITYQNGAAFTEDDTAFTVNYGGKSETIELETAVKGKLTFESAELQANAAGQPVLVVKGFFNAEGDDVKEQVEGFVVDCMERGTWALKTYTAKAEVNEDKSFTLTLTITDDTLKSGGQYYFHIKTGADGENFYANPINESAKPGNSNDNITAEFIGDPVTTETGVEYYFGNCEDWGKTIMIVVVDENAKEINVSSVALEDREGVAYVVYTGTSKNMTAEDLAAYYFDYEDSSGVNPLTFTVESIDEDGNFVMAADVSALPVDANWLHIGNSKTNLASGDAVEDKVTITIDGKTYTLTYSQYNCWQIVVS